MAEKNVEQTSTSNSTSEKGKKRVLSLDSSGTVTDRSVNVNKKARFGDLKAFVDHMDDSERKEIDVLLAKFIYSSSLPPESVESRHLNELISKLRPSYKLPDKEDISTSLLESVYNQLLSSARENAIEKGTILIEKDFQVTANSLTDFFN